MEITLTEKALETIKKLVEKDKTKPAVYVFLAGIGCGGGGKASFSLIPVEQKEDENILVVEGITFIYDRLILFHSKNLFIDYVPSAYDQEIRIESFIIKDAK
jgi:Fe-S cluster assembly iron-binding protein IscA